MRNCSCRPALLLLLLGVAACSSNEQAFHSDVHVEARPSGAQLERVDDETFILGGKDEVLLLQDLVRVAHDELGISFFLPSNFEDQEDGLRVIGTRLVAKRDLWTLIKALISASGFNIQELPSVDRAFVVQGRPVLEKPKIHDRIVWTPDLRILLRFPETGLSLAEVASSLRQNFGIQLVTTANLDPESRLLKLGGLHEVAPEDFVGFLETLFAENQLRMRDLGLDQAIFLLEEIPARNTMPLRPIASASHWLPGRESLQESSGQ